jgi:histidyl-tRNA synthetase
VIIGENEIARGIVQLRDLKRSAQHEIAPAEVAAMIRDTANEPAAG